MNTELAAISPVAQIRAHESTSEKYRFISTAEVVDRFKANGWQVVRTRVARSRRYQGFQRHVIELAPAEREIVVGDSHLRVIVTNSHHGGSSLRITLGLYRLVCSNGLVISSGSIEAARIRHIGDRVDRQVADFCDRINIAASRVGDLLARMSGRRLNPAEILSFTNQALSIRFRDNATDDMSVASIARRPADEDNTLWNVFNRVQENIIQGFTDLSGRRHRAITSPARDVEINEKMWKLAENYLAA